MKGASKTVAGTMEGPAYPKDRYVEAVLVGEMNRLGQEAAFLQDRMEGAEEELDRLRKKMAQIHEQKSALEEAIERLGGAVDSK